MAHRLNHRIVANTLKRVITATPGIQWPDMIDLAVLHLRCHPSTINNAVNKMRKEGEIVATGPRRHSVYSLAPGVEYRPADDDPDVCQMITKAKTQATIKQPKFTSGIAKFVWEAGRI